MGQLKSGRRMVESIFHLRGFKEVHMTDGLAFVLSRVPRLLVSLLKLGSSQVTVPDIHGLFVQRSSGDQGRTDIELVGPSCHLICEAKRGPCLPSQRQLTKYAQRLDALGNTPRELLVLSDSEPGYAKTRLNSFGLKVPVLFISWRQVYEAAVLLTTTVESREQVWLDELACYLGEHLRRIERPGHVRIVSLSHRQVPGRALSSIELLKQQRRYVHPIGNGYPKRPARLLGFRYGGYLQAVHPVLDIRHVLSLPDDIAAPDTQLSGAHYVYELGAAISLADKKQPNVPWKIRSGKIWDRPLWLPLAMLGNFDTLEEASAQQAAEHKQKMARKRTRAK